MQYMYHDITSLITPPPQSWQRPPAPRRPLAPRPPQPPAPRLQPRHLPPRLPLLAQLTPVVVQRLSSLSASVPSEAVPLGRPWRFVLDGDLDAQIARAGRLEARP